MSIAIKLAVTCEHKGCTIGTTGTLELKAVIGTYSDGSYFTTANCGWPKLPDGWVILEKNNSLRSWCPQHANEPTQ